MEGESTVIAGIDSEAHLLYIRDRWYPPVFDSIVHSMSIGFVGTELSTFSELGRLRVRDWNDGISRTVTLHTDD